MLVGKPCAEIQAIETMLRQLKCDVRRLQSPEQIVNPFGLNACLVILADRDQEWTIRAAQQLRQLAVEQSLTLVAVGDRTNAWLSTTPHPAIDGYLVPPFSRSVLSTLVHSAAVRQLCYSYSVATA